MQMKAAVFESYGPPEVLQIKDIPKPTPRENEVLVKVHACTVTSGDWRVRKAEPFLVRLMFGLTRPRVQVLGTEFAGVVEAVGAQVSLFKVGDAVFGESGFGMKANAEYLCLPENAGIIHKPDSLTFQQAAAIPFGAVTSLVFLREKAQLRQGQKLLIIGASGALGTYAVQLAKQVGAEVTGVCGPTNLELVRSLGADHVIDYTQEDYTQNGQTYDVIYDTVGKSSFAACAASLAPNGLFLAANGGLGEYLQMAWSSLKGGKKVICAVCNATKEHLLLLSELIEAGHLKAVIDRTYPLDEIVEAHAYVEQGHKKGVVVLQVHAES